PLAIERHERIIVGALGRQKISRPPPQKKKNKKKKIIFFLFFWGSPWVGPPTTLFISPLL
ncbi:hypothetical protein, partial [Corynebacterium diphtheriae]|uniref:hypothetical protein n=1 Tax=Corynebacterium diphtheriae TaxID=1717 RepID=UPI001C70CC0B